MLWIPLLPLDINIMRKREVGIKLYNWLQVLKKY